jgi:hypothetical protein
MVDGPHQMRRSEMGKTQRKTKRNAGKHSRQPRPRPGKKPFITRAEARRRAQRHVLDRIFKGAAVRDGSKVRLGIYIRGGWTSKDVWVVYKNPDGIALQSSYVVLVCKRTGRVLYEGSAGDEG